MTQDWFTQMRSVLRSVLLVATAAFGLMVACACAPPADPTAVEPEAGVPEPPPATAPEPAVPLAILPDGEEIVLELAITPEELAQGLMFRPRLPDNRGMLLVFSEERRPSIWMMNTLVALDLVYLDSNGTVVDIISDAQPCPAEPCPRFVPRQPARAVLEIPAGTAARHGLATGQALGFRRVPGFAETDPS
jgi:uncharacterized membrane protein (UPF0127 family)